MKLRSFDKTATVAWSASPTPLLAMGTAAGALDASFSASTELALVDVFNPSIKASTTASAKFNRLVWSDFKDSARPMGVIAGGLENGEVALWNAKALLDKKSDKEVLLFANKAHKGAVKGLGFNNVQTNLLASGSVDGEVFSWDINNPTKPYTPGTKSTRLEDITALSWNLNVPHILATASNNGNTVIWDLRNRRDISNLAYPGGRKTITALAWHPEEALQIATAADDDYNPSILLWDLRNAAAPIATLNGHAKGVLSISWCKKDSELLLSSGKDNKTLLWNVPAQAVLGELHTSANWAFDVKWCQKNPDLAAVASFDGKVTVHSIQGADAPVEHEELPVSPRMVSDDPFSAAIMQGMQAANQTKSNESSFCLKHPPKWFKRPVSAIWGFGGQLVTFSKSKPAAGNQTGAQMSSATVSIHHIPTDQKLSDRVNALKHVLLDDQLPSYVDFCQHVLESDLLKSKEDKDVWKYLQVMLSPDTAQISSFLGINSTEKNPKIEDLMAKLHIKDMKIGEDEQQTVKTPSASKQIDSFDQGDDVNGLFTDTTHNLDFPIQDISPAAEAPQPDQRPVISQPPKWTTPLKLFSKVPTEENEIDTMICKALVIGDFETAVKWCLATDRLADALMIAMNGPSELLMKTQREYFKRKSGKKSYSRILQGIVYQDLSDMVEHVDLEDGSVWKDVMAYLYTYGSPDVLIGLLNRLGHRLEELAATHQSTKRAEWSFAALLCFMGAGDITKVVQNWIHTPKKNVKYEEYASILQSLVEKVSVYRKAIHFMDDELVQTDKFTGFKLDSLYEHYVEYARVIAEQGFVDLAWMFLMNVPAAFVGSKPGLEKLPSSLRHLVAIKNGYREPNGSTPMLPFEVVDVIDEATIKARAAQVQQQQQQQASQNPYGGFNSYNQPQASFYGSQTAAPPANQYGGYQQPRMSQSNIYQPIAPPPANPYGQPTASSPSTNAYGTSPYSSGPTSYTPSGNTFNPSAAAAPYVPPPPPAGFAPQQQQQSTGYIPPQPTSNNAFGSNPYASQPMMNAAPAPPPAAPATAGPPPMGGLGWNPQSRSVTPGMRSTTPAATQQAPQSTYASFNPAPAPAPFKPAQSTIIPPPPAGQAPWNQQSRSQTPQLNYGAPQQTSMPPQTAPQMQAPPMGPPSWNPAQSSRSQTPGIQSSQPQMSQPPTQSPYQQPMTNIPTMQQQPPANQQTSAGLPPPPMGMPAWNASLSRSTTPSSSMQAPPAQMNQQQQPTNIMDRRQSQSSPYGAPPQMTGPPQMNAPPIGQMSGRPIGGPPMGQMSAPPMNQMNNPMMNSMGAPPTGPPQMMQPPGMSAPPQSGAAAQINDDINKLERACQAFLRSAAPHHRTLLQDCERKLPGLRQDMLKLPAEAQNLLHDIAVGVERYDWAKAREAQVRLMPYDSNGAWVLAVKRLVDFGEKGMGANAPIR